jgi:hypothetical protein
VVNMCRHKVPEIDCQYCTTSVCWAIVKDSKGMRETGHDPAVRWARAWLELDDQPVVVGTRRTHGQPGEGTDG